MKQLLTLTTVALLAASSVAHAGGLAPIATEQPEEVMDMVAPVGTSNDLIVPLLLLALIAAVASGSGSSSGDTLSDSNMNDMYSR